MARKLRELVGDEVTAVHILHKDGQTTYTYPGQDDERLLELDVDDIAAIMLEAEDGSVSLPFLPALARANVLLSIQVPIIACAAQTGIAEARILAMTAEWQEVGDDKCRELNLDPPPTAYGTKGNYTYRAKIVSNDYVCHRKRNT